MYLLNQYFIKYFHVPSFELNYYTVIKHTQTYYAYTFVFEN